MYEKAMYEKAMYEKAMYEKAIEWLRQNDGCPTVSTQLRLPPR
jgi:hypothetical protein